MAGPFRPGVRDDGQLALVAPGLPLRANGAQLAGVLDAAQAGQLVLPVGGGLQPTWVTTSAGFRDTSVGRQAAGYQRRDLFAWVVVETDDTQVTVDFWTSTFAIDPGSSCVLVETEGLGCVRADATANNAINSVTVSPHGAGTRRLHLSDGPQTAGGTGLYPPLGTWITGVRAVTPGATLRVLDAYAPTWRLGIVGDSLDEQGNANQTWAREAYGQRMRQGIANLSVDTISYGYAAVVDWYNLDGFNTLCGLIRQLGLDQLLFKLGTNDFSTALVTRETAAQFRAYLDILLPRVRTENPATEIVVQTMPPRTAPAVNGHGQVIEDYRVELRAAAAPIANCRVIEGASYWQAGDLIDGVHFSTDAHGRAAPLYATNLRGAVQLYGAGPYSAGNLLRAAPGTTLDITNGQTVVLQWYQRAPAALNDTFASCISGTFANGLGWLLFAGAATTLYLLRYETPGPGSPCVLDTSNAIANVGLHCAAFSIVDGAGNVRSSVDGLPYILTGINPTYAPPVGARFEFGSATSLGAFYNANADLCGMAVIPAGASLGLGPTGAAYDLQALSAWGKTRPLSMLVELAPFLWEARVDYNPALFTPQPSRGTAPIALTQEGSVPRTARP